MLNDEETSNQNLRANQSYAGLVGNGSTRELNLKKFEQKKVRNDFHQLLP
jgi:hypothetical protein